VLKFLSQGFKVDIDYIRCEVDLMDGTFLASLQGGERFYRRLRRQHHVIVKSCEIWRLQSQDTIDTCEAAHAGEAELEDGKILPSTNRIGQTFFAQLAWSFSFPVGR